MKEYKIIESWTAKLKEEIVNAKKELDELYNHSHEMTKDLMIYLAENSGYKLSPTVMYEHLESITQQFSWRAKEEKEVLDIIEKNQYVLDCLYDITQELESINNE